MNLHRIIIIVSLLILLLSLSVFTVLYSPWIHLNECIAHPDRYDGRIVTHFNEARIGEIYPDGFLLLQKGPSIRVYSDTSGLVKGEYVSLKAVFHRDDYLEALDYHVAENRKQKMWVSVLPVLLILALLARKLRFDRGKGILVWRKHA